MVKKISLPAILVMFLLWSCVTYQPPPPDLYIESLPPTEVSTLSLEERLIAEDAWRSIKQGNANKAIKLIARLDQGNPFYYAGLGYAYYVLNDIPRAENYFKAASAAFNCPFPPSINRMSGNASPSSLNRRKRRETAS